ncbi:Inner membrane component domain-containing protein [Bifidobacterium goeldii]|uniref:Inner membrane component domain-containing protein n=2 Tax=Bifidobacterium goeldii TaxID=2306975 RepID=A0A430FLI5_9BIFI|nr:Inner membrane component domain-containing protein [Bifidobacterium goeldii]
MIEPMRLLGNILWLVLGGLAIAIGWAIVGLILCVTIVGIPLGLQAFKMAGLTLTPFGSTVVYGGGIGSTLVNILWVLFIGWWMAVAYLGAGLLNCITIIGIPFGLQSFKMAKLALWPFGARIVSL